MIWAHERAHDLLPPYLLNPSSRRVSAAIEEALFALLDQAGPSKSVSPEQVARAAAGEGWRRALPQVRATAVGLARQGRLLITRHNRAVDPHAPFKGVYRLSRPEMSAEPPADG